MTDLSQTIAPKSDQLNADDLIAGPRTITVTRVNGNDDVQQPISIFFEGDNGKPYKPCLSMRRVMVQVWGGDGTTYPGRSMTLYNDPTVQFGGMKVGGIRISHMSHIDKVQSLMLTTTRSRRAEYIVRPLASNPNEQILLVAQEEAGKGKQAFTNFWNSEQGKAHRDYLKPHLPDLQRRAEEAEEAAKPLSQRIDTQEEPSADPETSDAVIEGNPDSQQGDEGATAWMHSVTFKECPYPDGSQEQADWQAGWVKVDEENKDT